MAKLIKYYILTVNSKQINEYSYYFYTLILKYMSDNFF